MLTFPENFTIALVSPSGLCDKEVVDGGRQFLENSGASVKVMPHIFTHDSLAHLSASDELRAADINSALADEEVDMIWAVRGGCGALRILDKIDWQLFQKRQIPFAGFSDITAIHWAMAKMGVDSYIAAPMMKFLSDKLSPVTANTLSDALKGVPVSLSLNPLSAAKITEASPLPGNITVAAALCGTEFFPDTKGKVLILEEIGEAPYRIERALTQLRLAGAFRNAAGVVFGNFTSCGEKEELAAILRDFADQVDCPVFYGLPHGHELPFFSISASQLISVQPR